MINKTLRVPYALAVHGKEEKARINKVLNEKRTNMGSETREFESSVAKAFGKKFGIMVNSGSSANLLALELLNLPKGSEIITPMLTFSTTIAPMVKLELVPVFVDVENGKYTMNANQVEKLITKKTKAIMAPLLLGNIPNLKKLKAIAKKNKLFLVEDSCDTLGGTFDGKPTGTYSDITTTSFFGSHIITAGGNGGMIMINDAAWANRLKMLRGWGRSSALFGESENLQDRFSKKIKEISYDAKFIFDEIGYNFLPNEMGAAFGNEQMKKLPTFRKTRMSNFKKLSTFFKKYDNYFTLPIQEKNVSTQWLAFPLTIKPLAPFTRLRLVTFLEENNIQTRPVFTGNILFQPGFEKINCKVLKGGYPITNDIMKNGFVIGCHQGITESHIKKIQDVMNEFLQKF